MEECHSLRKKVRRTATHFLVAALAGLEALLRNKGAHVQVAALFGCG
jgi:hypothetical protein